MKNIHNSKKEKDKIIQKHIQNFPFKIKFN